MKLTNGDIEQFLMDRPRSVSYRKLCGYLLWPFKKWLGNRDLTEGEVKLYVGKQYKNPKSHNTFLAVMKSFANWKMKRLPQDDLKAFIRDRQTLELIKDIRRDRVVVRLERKELSMDELGMIFSSLEGVKFSCLWSLAWFGCRPRELVALALTPHAIDKKPDTYLPEALAKELRPDEYCVKFLTGKTVVERAVFMDGFTKGHLENFIKSGCGYKFLYDTCVDLQNMVGVKFTPKWFRSTFQTKMQRALTGVPTVKLDLLVKVMSGHTVGQDITSVYTDYGSDIKKAMTELHYMIPIEKKLGKKGLTLEELERVLGKYPTDSLKFSVIWLLFWFGVRSRELVALEDRMVNFKVGKVVFEERELYFDPFTTEHLERFLSAKPSYSFVYKVCKEVEIEPKASRQSFISHMSDITAIHTDLPRDIERAFRESHYMIPIEKKLIAGKIERFYTFSPTHREGDDA